MIAQTIVHYSLHFLAPALLAYLFWGRKRWWAAYRIMILTMLVDLDHLLANPIFDPSRASIGFHPLHTYPMIGVYVVMCLLPYERWGWSWWWRVIGVGLAFHMFTDWQDYYFWH